jgi:hypothetical protein
MTSGEGVKILAFVPVPSQAPAWFAKRGWVVSQQPDTPA